MSRQGVPQRLSAPANPGEDLEEGLNALNNWNVWNAESKWKTTIADPSL
jgi:hypothetical protein